jgi:hypothetical protein
MKAREQAGYEGVPNRDSERLTAIGSLADFGSDFALIPNSGSLCLERSTSCTRCIVAASHRAFQGISFPAEEIVGVLSETGPDIMEVRSRGRRSG